VESRKGLHSGRLPATVKSVTLQADPTEKFLSKLDCFNTMGKMCTIIKWSSFKNRVNICIPISFIGFVPSMVK
jgi:hypothetical protein